MANGEEETEDASLRRNNIGSDIIVEGLQGYDLDNLFKSVSDKLGRLPNDSYTVCIYRVSEKYRKINEEAYTPRLVSIGPLHHGERQLQAMEAHKWKYLRSFKSRLGGIDRVIRAAAEEERSVRGCYEDASKFSSKDFTEMILLDGVFIVELLLRKHLWMREPTDVIFQNKWMERDIMHDMLLLENQLPIRFLEKLFNFVADSRHNSFHELARKYFKDVGNIQNLQLPHVCMRARHFVEFLVYFIEPSSEVPKGSQSGKFEYNRSASELREAGVQFTAGSGNSLFDVSFSNGNLTIPKLIVDEHSETLFRNLIAFEQCGHHSNNITSYVMFMDILINTANDVDILVKSNIIENRLGENEQVAVLFNNLYKEVIPDQIHFYFAEICNGLERYTKDFLHKWKSRWFRWKLILRRDYFNNPWSVLSLIAAILLLILSLIQAVCSMIQVI